MIVVLLIVKLRIWTNFVGALLINFWIYLILKG